jgi:hypothetical protein
VTNRVQANDDGHHGEPNRIGSIRHEWTVFGGMDVGGSYMGFFERCLRESGFRTK